MPLLAHSLPQAAALRTSDAASSTRKLHAQLLTTVAFAGVLAIGVSSAAMAVTAPTYPGSGGAGGNGGGGASAGAGGYTNGDTTGNGTSATAAYGGGGGGAGDLGTGGAGFSSGNNFGGNGGQGGYSGFVGTVEDYNAANTTSKGGSAGLPGGTGYLGGPITGNETVGGGGGGGGGAGIVITGAATPGATVTLTGTTNNGGYGGGGNEAYYNVNGATVAGALVTVDGGNGGDGGAAVQLAASGLNVDNASTLAGGHGGFGGEANYNYATSYDFGASSTANGGLGGKGGAGLLTIGGGTITNTGLVTGGYGGAGGGAYSYLSSDTAVPGSATSGAGGAGGIGIVAGAGSTLNMSGGSATGGAGGNGGYAEGDDYSLATALSNALVVFGGTGGDGGAGASLGAGANLNLTGGSLQGGNGGFGGEADYYTSYGYGYGYGASIQSHGGNGGEGGAGLVILGGGTVSVSNGAYVEGGVGGYGSEAHAQGGSYGNGSAAGGNGGVGGNGITALAGGGVVNNNGDIYGGAGGYGAGADLNGPGSLTGGTGGVGGSGIYGDGVTVHNLTNGSIQGGSGGDYYGGFSDAAYGTPGAGGSGIYLVGTQHSVVENDASAYIQGGSGASIGYGYGIPPGIPGLLKPALISSGITYTDAAAPVGDTSLPYGGAGIAGSNATIINHTDGGNGGGIYGGNAGSAPDGAFVYGGAGITGSDLHVITGGTIQGGYNSDDTRAAAIVFTGGTNSLTLLPGATGTTGYGILGPVIAASTADSFILGTGNETYTADETGVTDPTVNASNNGLHPEDAGNGTLDTSLIGDGSKTTDQFIGFGVFKKEGSNTWTLTGGLTGGTNYLTPWQILGGTLVVDSDNAANNVNELGDIAGKVTLNGGTLETTADITTPRGFLIGANGGGINTDAGTTLILTGGVDNDPAAATAGALTKIGTGTLELDGDKTYTGGTNINEGQVSITTGGGLGTGLVNMADGTQLNYLGSFTVANNFNFTGALDPVINTGANTDTMTGLITGAGNLTKMGTGTLTLTNTANSYSGGTVINEGTLVGSVGTFGSGAITDNAALVIDQGTDASLTNSLTGAGSLTKTGAGTLTIATTNPDFTGATTVQQGILVANGTLPNSTVTVDSGSTLGGFGTIGSFNALAGSTVSPGVVTPYSTLNATGNITFQAGSTYDVHINAAGQTDLITAAGTSTINGGTVDVLAGNGLYSPDQSYRIIHADGGSTGTFNTLTTTSNLAFLSPYLDYDPNNVYLRFRQTATFASVGNTFNEINTATGIQSLGLGNPLYNAVLSQSAGGARQAFNAASGEIHASAVAAGYEDSRLPRESILDHLDDVISAPPGALGAVTTFGAPGTLPPAAQGYAPVRKGYDTPVLAAVAPPAPAYTAWGTGFGDFGQIKGNGNAATIDRSLGGFVAGVDTRVDWQNWSNWHIGVAGGYTSDQLSVKGRGSSGTYETYFGGLYAGAQYGAWNVKLGALGGGTSTDTTRSIVFPGFVDAARSSYNGTMAQGFAELGYKFGYGNGFIEPVVQGVALHLGQDGYRERGGPAALVGFAKDYDIGSVMPGIRAEVALPWGGLPLIARGFIGYRYAFGDITPKVNEAFLSGGSVFTIAGTPIDRNAVVGEAGIDYRASNNLTIGISYSGQAGDRAYDNAVKGKLEYKF